MRDEHELLLPVDMPEGQYELRVGMYILETMERLMVVESEQEVEGDMIVVGTVRVRQSTSRDDDCRKGRHA